jgi:transposase
LEVRAKSPFVTMAFVDGSYQGDEAQRAAFKARRIARTVIKRTDSQIKDFVVLPGRYVVERTFGWINRSRRLAKDFEASIASAIAWFQMPERFSSCGDSRG